MTRRSQVLAGLGVGCLAFAWCVVQAPIHGHADHVDVMECAGQMNHEAVG